MTRRARMWSDGLVIVVPPSRDDVGRVTGVPNPRLGDVTSRVLGLALVELLARAAAADADVGACTASERVVAAAAHDAVVATVAVERLADPGAEDEVVARATR